MSITCANAVLAQSATVWTHYSRYQEQNQIKNKLIQEIEKRKRLGFLKNE